MTGLELAAIADRTADVLRVLSDQAARELDASTPPLEQGAPAWRLPRVHDTPALTVRGGGVETSVTIGDIAVLSTLAEAVAESERATKEGPGQFSSTDMVVPGSGIAAHGMSVYGRAVRGCWVERGAEPAPVRSGFAADAVVFAQGHVLLIQRGKVPYIGCWALPGGQVDDGEEFEAAARRELKEETGATAPEVLEQVTVYHAPGRDPRRRMVSVAYTGILPTMVDVSGQDDARFARWVPVADVLNDRVELAFDHQQIVWDAWKSLHDQWPRWRAWQARRVLGGGRRG